MILKQKTAALKEKKHLIRDKKKADYNGRFEHFQFGNNVFLDIPAYQRNGDYRIAELDETKEGVILRLYFRDRHLEVDLNKCDFSKCRNCYARTYNHGIEENLCYDPVTCPAVNPDITNHKKFAQEGHRARYYPSQLKEDPNLA